MLKIVIKFLLLAGIAQGQFNCPGEGLYADPTNCQNYYYCYYDLGTDGIPTIRPHLNTCEAGLLFQEDIKLCNYCQLVNCGSRPRPTTCETVPTNPSTLSSSSSSTTTNAVTASVTPPSSRYDERSVGIYITLADETVPGFGTFDDWNPELYEYQQLGSNVLFFTFINPADMVVPRAFQNLAATRGTNAPGAVPQDTLILFAIGGFLYSVDPNPWPWLVSQASAEAMAEEVATWPAQYGCDGIDLDIEGGAGDRLEAGPNLVHFIRKLRELQPDMIIGQPTYGFPQVQAEIDVINASWNPGGTSNNLADSIGLMVYEGTQALNYVENYAHGTDQWEGFPIRVDVPYNAIFVGCKGTSSAADINTLATESIRQNLRGIMVWYASVRNGFQYEVSWDSSMSTESQNALIEALSLFQSS